MLPRLYMHSVQYVFYDNHYEEVLFESRMACGRRFTFVLSRNQFLNLHDAISQIEKFKYYGHFPLGQNTWLHYNAFDSCLYRESNEDRRLYFTFISFTEYIKHTHPRLLSLVRHQKDELVATRRRGSGDDGRRQRAVKSTAHKRPLSTVSVPSHQSSEAKRSRGEECKATSRSTNDAVVSNIEEASAILSKWDRSSARWRSDSSSSESSAAEDMSTSLSL